MAKIYHMSIRLTEDENNILLKLMNEAGLSKSEAYRCMLNGKTTVVNKAGSDAIIIQLKKIGNNINQRVKLLHKKNITGKLSRDEILFDLKVMQSMVHEISLLRKYTIQDN